MANANPAMLGKDGLFHGARAHEYDDFGKAIPHHDTFQREVAQVVRERVHGTVVGGRGAMVAELGVGTGITLSFVIEETRGLRGIQRLFAIDPSAEMVRMVGADFKSLKIETAVAGILDYLQIQPPGRDFDIIYSAFTIHNMPQEEQMEIFSRIYRNLGSGGAFVDGDIFAYDDPAVQAQVFEWYLERFRSELPGPLRGEWIAHYHADAPNYFTLMQALSLLTRAGFEVSVRFREKLEAVILATKP